jgi:uncharacterized delta-60 repeat protein
MWLVPLLAACLAVLAWPALAAAAAGDLDPSFGTAGVSSLGSVSELNAVAIQGDGRIVAAGDAGSSLLVARFSATGAFQGSFAAGTGVGRGIAVQSDGKIVVAGDDAAGMLVERFNPDGSPDSGFGSGGVVHAFPGARANGLALGPGGTIVAAGQVRASDSFERVAVLRLNANGSPDTSIGPGGLHLIDLGEDSLARGVTVQGDGKIVLAGSIGPGTHQSMAAFVARLATNGNLDTGFGSGGTFIAFSQPGGAAVSLNAVSLDPAGGIVVGGGSTATNQSQAVFYRLTCSGGLDTSFAGGGVQVVPSSRAFATDPIGVNAVVVAGGRRLVGAGEYRDSGLTSAALWSFEPGGTPDFANVFPSGARSTALAVDSAGNLVVAGSNVPLGLAPSGFVARYLGFGGRASGSTPCGGSTAPPPGPGAPTVSNQTASGITSNSANVAGAVNANGGATSYHFDFGRTAAYGSQTATGSAGSGTTIVAVAAHLSGLAPSATYHYRLVAINAAGTTAGNDQTFTTAAPPPPQPVVVSKFKQSHRNWAESGLSTRRRPVGTTFSFTLNVGAQVVLQFNHSAAGRRVNGKCVAATRQNRSQRSCRRTLTDGTLSFVGRVGPNQVSFQGRLSRFKQLKPGGFSVVLTANVGRKKSKPQSLGFTIIA